MRHGPVWIGCDVPDLAEALDRHYDPSLGVTAPARLAARVASRGGALRLAYAAACAGGCVVYLSAQSLGVRTAISISIPASGTLGALAGIRLNRPRSRYWVIVAAIAAFWMSAWTIWQMFVYLHQGTAPGLSSWRNFQFLCFYPLCAVVLLGLLVRREGRRAGILDAAIIATSCFAIAWIVLGRLYADDAGLTLGVRSVQIAFLAGDIAVIAAAVRLLVSPGRRSPALLLLVAGTFAVVYSDFVWNWTTKLDRYTPGSWADLGWVTFGAFFGLAALHPSMRGLFDGSGHAAGRERRAGLTLLFLTSLVVPATVVVTAVGAYRRRDVVVVALLGGALTLLILFRLALAAAEEAKLARVLAAQNERLVELDRMKEDFVASVSHELRTPLTSIRGYLEIVQAGQVGELNAEQARFLGIVERNAERLLRVVGDLLFAAQVGAGKVDLMVEDVDLEEICRHAALAARPHVESKGVELVERIGALTPIRGDPARLGQVVDNLLSNAIKFTDTGGRIELSAHSANGAAVVEVEDSGQGMTDEELAQLFQRFYRTESAVDQAIQGTGLGLTIVKAIVEGHGGSIEVRSAKDAGTTFRVELPAAGADSHRSHT